MWQSDTITEISKALSAMQSEMTPLKKNKENPFFKASYADLEATIMHIKPLVSKHKLSYVQFPSKSGSGEPTLTTQIMHDSGEWLRSESPLFLAKQDQQSVGSAITYAKRQSLQAAFGVPVTDEDDDGEANAVLPLNKARELYKLAQEHRGISDEYGFSELLRAYYNSGVTKDRIPKSDWNDLVKYMSGEDA